MMDLSISAPWSSSCEIPYRFMWASACFSVIPSLTNSPRKRDFAWSTASWASTGSSSTRTSPGCTRSPMSWWTFMTRPDFLAPRVTSSSPLSEPTTSTARSTGRCSISAIVTGTGLGAVLTALVSALCPHPAMRIAAMQGPPARNFARNRATALPSIGSGTTSSGEKEVKTRPRIRILRPDPSASRGSRRPCGAVRQAGG